MSLPSLSLDAFFACSQTGNFTQAALALHITQSAVSQRVAKLEVELGTSLFVRAPSGLRLTAAGEELVRYCLAKNSLEEESLAKIQGRQEEGMSGVIRIGGFSSIMRSVILPAIAPLLEENPNILLSVVTKEMNELPKLLQFGEIDYMIHYQGLIKDEVETLKLGDEPNVLVERKNYSGPNIFLDHDEKDEATAKYLKLRNDKKSYQRRYLDDVYGLIDGVKMGLGRAVIPKHLVEKEKDLKIVNPRTTINFPVILHYYRQPYYTELHKKFISIMSDLNF